LNTHSTGLDIYPETASSHLNRIILWKEMAKEK
jgi:hypothetical protein